MNIFSTGIPLPARTAGSSAGRAAVDFGSHPEQGNLQALSLRILQKLKICGIRYRTRSTIPQ